MDLPASPPAASGGPGPTAAWITEQAEGRLHGHRYGALRAVTCAFHGGVLALHGRLPSYYLKQVAQEAVTGIPGVLRIHNGIEVAAPSLPAELGEPGAGTQR